MNYSNHDSRKKKQEAERIERQRRDSGYATPSTSEYVAPIYLHVPVDTSSSDSSSSCDCGSSDGGGCGGGE